MDNLQEKLDSITETVPFVADGQIVNEQQQIVTHNDAEVARIVREWLEESYHKRKSSKGLSASFWRWINVVTILGFTTMVMAWNANNFDETELKALSQIALGLIGLEGIRAHHNRPREKNE